MTDLITRARKEWCESRFGPNFPSDWTTPDHSHHQCPPDVVAALLDLRNAVHRNHGGRKRDDECDECIAMDAVDAAITRALEGK
jgi:hypothetical protein